jgi:hypothetical protein
MAEAKKSAAKKTATKKVPAKKPVVKAATKKSAAKKAAPTKKPVASAKKAPTYQQIAELAHRYWAERGGHHGSDREDWLRAERELRIA